MRGRLRQCGSCRTRAWRMRIHVLSRQVLLSKPTTLDLVEPDQLDNFISASERFERAAVAADAAAYASSMGDFSAQTGFEIGAASNSPNLERALELTSEVRDTIAEILAYLVAPE